MCADVWLAPVESQRLDGDGAFRLLILRLARQSRMHNDVNVRDAIPDPHPQAQQLLETHSNPQQPTATHDPMQLVQLVFEALFVCVTRLVGRWCFRRC